MQHITVLQQEAVDGLSLTASDIVVDATYGAGGHAEVIISRLGTKGTYIGIDADSTAFLGKNYDGADPTIHLVNDNFRNLSEILSSLHITHADAILADLGWRMEQFAEGGKGFSFKHNEPLLMTFGDPAAYEFTALDIVNDWAEDSIADIIFGYGEEKAARKIAHAIVTTRKVAPLKTTEDLVACIESVIPRKYFHKVHPATKTFQALRIAVNDELGTLESFLQHSMELLAPGGRLAIITFHSLEDRIVKHTFRSFAEAERGTIITKKPIVASDTQRQNNPRARSAKLRIIRKN